MPDLYYRAYPEQIKPAIQDQLLELIGLSTENSLPVTPNTFLAVKEVDGTPAVAKRQAAYDAALGARAIQALESFGRPHPTFDTRLKAISSTYVDGKLALFDTHVLSPMSPRGSRHSRATGTLEHAAPGLHYFEMRCPGLKNFEILQSEQPPNSSR